MDYKRLAIIGLPGTGKTLCSHVVRSFGYEPGTRETGMVTSYMCKVICKALDSDAYPYYMPYRRGWVMRGFEGYTEPPEVMTIAFIAAVPSILERYPPEAVIYCHREYDPWVETVKIAEPTRELDLEGAYKSSFELMNDLGNQTVTFRFNVDKMEFTGPNYRIRDEISLYDLNKKLKELLEKNPNLGR